MSKPEDEGSRRISVDLPIQLIERFDELKREWGLRGRGAVLKRLLEVILSDTPEDQSEDENDISNKSSTKVVVDDQSVLDYQLTPTYNEHKAIVLIGKSNIEKKNYTEGIQLPKENTSNPIKARASNNRGINLPNFVKDRTDNLRASLGKSTKVHDIDEPIVTSVLETDVRNSLQAAYKHWISLYGQEPTDVVVEAAMIWLARDIWSSLFGNECRPFTWSQANRLVTQYCHSWVSASPTFEKVMVIAGILEDPFGSQKLPERMPSLIRRFVISFKRSQNVTSFQTLESTMTVHGALKLLDLSIKAGTSISLANIREAYKQKALSVHPDSGGNTESMRRLNEAYQLLKELYRQGSD